MNYLTIQEIRSIGQLAANCDKEKLNIAENEAMLFDIKPMIACYFDEIKNHWDDESGKWADILNPKNYDVSGCGGCGYHEGLKKALAYYTYSRYLIINEFNDTPNGNVAKTNNFSMPTDTRLIKDRANAYREMARETFKEIENYMLTSGEYPKYFAGKEQAKGFGVKIRNY